MAADAAAFANINLSVLSDATKEKLNKVLPTSWSHANPVDIIGDAPVERYEAALKILLADPDAGAILFIHAPTAIVSSTDIARALVPLAQPLPGAQPRVMGCWLGDQAVAEARQLFQDAGIANFDTPEQAVRAFSMLTRYRRNQAELTEAPPAMIPNGPAPDWAQVRSVVTSALANGDPSASARTLLVACEAHSTVPSSAVSSIQSATRF